MSNCVCKSSQTGQGDLVNQSSNISYVIDDRVIQCPNCKILSSIYEVDSDFINQPCGGCGSQLIYISYSQIQS